MIVHRATVPKRREAGTHRVIARQLVGHSIGSPCPAISSQRRIAQTVRRGRPSGARVTTDRRVGPCAAAWALIALSILATPGMRSEVADRGV